MDNNLKIVVIIAISLTVGLGRTLIHVDRPLSLEMSYEALAHIWVGILLCLGFSRCHHWYDQDGHHQTLQDEERAERRAVAWFCLVTITALEVVKFFTDRR